MRIARQSAVIGLLAAGMLSACADPASTTPPPLPPLALDARILAVGDSLTAGTGAQRRQDYPTQLAQLSGRTVIGAGIPGETTLGARRRLERLLQRHNPDLLLLCSGANDFLRGLSTTQAEQNLTAMVEIAQRHQVPVVLIGVPADISQYVRQVGHLPLAGDVPSVAPMYYRIARRHRLWLEERAVLLALTQTDMMSGGDWHPNHRGYRLYAENIHQLLVQAGALPPSGSPH